MIPAAWRGRPRRTLFRTASVVDKTPAVNPATVTVSGAHLMRRFLVLAGMLAASPGQALDCGKLADGHSPISGALTVKNAKTGSIERFGIGIERGAHTFLKLRSAAAGTPEIVNEFDRGVLIATSTVSAAPAMKYEVQPVDGDMWSLAPGAASSYRKTITLGGKPYGVETTTQTIGAHETRSLFGCDVEIVHVHRETDTKTQNQSVSGYRAVVDEDYAPALGVDVHFVNIFRSPTLELRTESTLESVSTD